MFESPVARTFINVTGQGENEFAMSEVVQLGEGYEKYLHLFRYENGKLTSLGTVKYEDFSKVSATVATFSQQDQTFYVHFYKNKKLVGVATYQWKDGQIVKTNEIKQ
ncbi:hypothetical protein [Aneurinibacillus tyrosinisolvens]|uniref:hypothetical protein n=1 Tax=Aneurinibacillus tyrosinisolvens TaxID=1443435 RepID=UPI00063F0621|nr:hypothetical protein [Aneurinibacillus tyrosinisolvens]